MWEYPEYIDIDGPEQFCEAVKTTLTLWMDMHTNRDAWTQSWLAGCETSYTYGLTPVISNDYFTFDWTAAAYALLANDYRGDFEKCAHCGSLWDYSSFDCDCQEETESEPIDDTAYLAEWLQGCEYPLSETVLERSLLTAGFDAYREALAPVTAGIEEEIKECLDAIAAAKDNYSLIQACMWATRVYHVNGNVMDDYGDYTGLEVGMIDDVRNEGLESRFDRDEIREFITGGLA